NDARGFWTPGVIFWALPGPPAKEVAAADVFLVPIESGVAGAHHPIEVRYRDDGGPFGGPYLLSLLPLQGRPLMPHTLYAAVVTSALVAAAPFVATTPDRRRV